MTHSSHPLFFVPSRPVRSRPVRSCPVLSHPFLVPAAQGAPFLRLAGQGATGDPRLPSRHRALASQAPPSRGWHVASCHPAPFFVWQPRAPPSCVWQGRVPPATRACPPGTRLSLRRHPLAGGGMSPHATLPRLPHEPSGRGSPFMDGREAADLLGDHTLSLFAKGMIILGRF